MLAIGTLVATGTPESGMMMMKWFTGLVVVGRVVGLGVGAGVWRLVVSPILGASNPVPGVVAFLVLALVGIYAGEWLMLEFLARR
jgi:hypothetical protein